MKEALKLALEALESCYSTGDDYKYQFYDDDLIIPAITAIKEALAQPDPYMQGYADAMNWKVQNHLEHLTAAQPEQEPVAWMNDEMDCIFFDAERPEPFDFDFWKPLYTTPPQRTWVGLTPQERDEINEQVYGAVPHHVAFHHAIEAKLRSKNENRMG